MIFKKNKIVLYTVICLLLCLITGRMIFRQQLNRILQEDKIQVKEILTLNSNYLSVVTNKRIAFLSGLKAYIMGNLESGTPITWNEFNIVTEQLYNSARGIRNISIAIGGVQKFIYPLSGNETVLQHDLINDERPNVRADVQRAIQSGQIVLSGPYELRQGGGLALVARLAVFHNDKFWGLVNMVMDIQPILEEAGFLDENLSIELSIKRSDGVVFWGNEQVFDQEHVKVLIDVPEGNWEIAGRPVGGWYKSRSVEILSICLVIIMISFLISFIVYLIASSHEKLKLGVRKGTKELSEANEALKQEMLEHKQAEESRQESEAMFKSVFSQAPIGIELYDWKGNLISVNQACLNIFGVGSVEEIKGFKLFEDPIISAEAKAQLKNGEPIDYEAEFDFEVVKKLKLYKTTRSGKCFLHLQITPYEISVRGNRGFVVHVQDTTGQKKAMEEIEKLAKFPTENPNPVLCISKDGIILYHNYASESLLRHWHYKEGEPLQDKWHQFVLDVLEDNDIKNLETEIGDKVISLTFAPIAEKGFVNVYGLDITESKRVEEELRKHREHLEKLVKERTTKLEEKTKAIEKSQQALIFLTEDVNEIGAELEDVNKKLETSNKDLEAFAYSVSHDLRGPLRAINGFTRILMENYVAKLDTEGKRLGGIIQQNAKKMGQLIEDLLAFSRMGRTSMSFSVIDMKEMVNAIYHEATNAENRKRITFTIADLPKAEGDTNMMRQMWMNLISNAVKFSANRKQAIISVTCQEEENKLIYCIKDNGAGFNMKYKNKLFGVFQRLHSEKEFEGTGVGLALVQRVIHRQGGEVWAKAEVDNGAAFYFSLPKNRKI